MGDDHAWASSTAFFMTPSGPWISPSAEAWGQASAILGHALSPTQPRDFPGRKLRLTSYVITNHAREEMTIRGIVESTLDAVIWNPGQIVSVRDGLVAYQSVVSTDSGRDVLVRVIATQGESHHCG